MRSSLDIEQGDTLETVLDELTHAIQWCRSRSNINEPKHCFRSMELLPNALEDGRKRVVKSVACKRYIALGHPTREAATSLAGGRLLIYEPDINLGHGLEEAETNGFVDHDNTPPWDTWIAYIYEPGINYLLSWVPVEFIPVVTAGISVSPEESFRWLDEEDLILTALLRKRRLA